MQDEGVIKFDLRFTRHAPLSLAPFAELNHWRGVLWERELIGQDPSRYGGYSFGNVSQRLPDSVDITGERAFLISGSQTGHIATLDADHYAVVSHYDPARNSITAYGPIRPSSESLTHGMVYDQSYDIRVVLHVHSPVIWQAAERLSLPLTAASVEYGTSAMAQEVARLFQDSSVARKKLFAMGGHKDGIVAFGNTAEEAGVILLDTLEQSRTAGQWMT